MSVYRLEENNSDLVLQFVTDVLPIVGCNILCQLLPWSTNLIWCRLLTVVKHIGAKIGTNTFSCCIGRASVILASSSTASSAATSTASTATVVPSTAHLDRSSGIMSMLRFTNIVGHETWNRYQLFDTWNLIWFTKIVGDETWTRDQLFQTWNSIKLFLESRRRELNPRLTMSKAT
jgi:hypothetical protein